MGKTEIICPHCGVKKYKVETEKNDSFKKLKGGNWRPLLTVISEDEWTEDPNFGIAVQCSCGRYFMINGFTKDATEVHAYSSLKPNQSLAVYCETCRKAFLDPSLKCPNCDRQY